MYIKWWAIFNCDRPKEITKIQHEFEICCVLEYYEKNNDISLPMLTEQLSVPPSKVEKSREKNIFKDAEEHRTEG